MLGVSEGSGGVGSTAGEEAGILADSCDQEIKRTRGGICDSVWLQVVMNSNKLAADEVPLHLSYVRRNVTYVSVG